MKKTVKKLQKLTPNRSAKTTQRNTSKVKIRISEAKQLAKKNSVLSKTIESVKAELKNKTRELEIEAALEQVRSRALAMTQSSELKEVVSELYRKLQDLEFGIDKGAALVMTFSPDSKDHTQWITDAKQSYAIPFYIPFTEHSIARDQINARRKRQTFLGKVYNQKEKNEYFKYLFKNTDYKHIPEDVKNIILKSKQFGISIAFENNSAIAIPSTVGKLVSGNEINILKRFSKVFEQCYTRFLDLQKAEAQAREAQIEAALERVRSSTMGMQKSEDLREVVKILYAQLKELGFQQGIAAINIMDPGSGDVDSWSEGFEDGYDLPEKYHVPYSEHRGQRELITHWKIGTPYAEVELSGEEKKSFDNYYFYHTDFVRVPEATKQLIMQQEVVRFSMAYMQYGALTWTPSPLSVEQSKILQRFAKVFEQTYTRFLDLQKAEAQSRESQIQLALERVRARTMAMQHSRELAEAAQLLYQQFHSLGIKTSTCAYMFIEEENNRQRGWAVAADGSILPDFFDFPLKGDTVLDQRFESWKQKQALHETSLKGQDNERHHQYLVSLQPPEFARQIVDHLPDQVFFYNANFSHGYLFFVNTEPFTPEEKGIAIRFAKVFDQTYTRFLDLKKAEAQAREAQIEAALEKVRSRTMAMQSSEELADGAYVLFEQLNILGVTHERINIGIVNEQNQTIDFWVTEQGGEKLNTKFSGRISEPTTLSKAYEAWKKGEKSLIVDLKGEDLKSWLKYIYEEIKIPFNNAFLHDRRVQTIGFFSKGMLVLTSPEPLQEEALYLLEKFAGVFDLTYTRFSDLKIAETHARQAEQDLIAIKEAKQKAETALSELQATQKQLIQAEKMASLGELTAGIAHEIQNPLNFVNNFSEVSKELLQEMNTALEKGDTEEAREIATDLIQNLEKINHHGKRADTIVKSMLQHSRISSGKKEQTDINSLCDEYVRLAYHGLRAKDKSFNAKFETQLDSELPKLNVLPQEIGRVILNLINNAFYAVSEKAKVESQKSGASYEPTVTVSTKNLGDKIEISVEDNGTGIPQKVLDKIFQPFFTTKPTGQGTGLGLSLSYDIIKAHGGELKVETEVGNGTNFIINLHV